MDVCIYVQLCVLSIYLFRLLIFDTAKSETPNPLCASGWLRAMDSANAGGILEPRLLPGSTNSKVFRCVCKRIDILWRMGREVRLWMVALYNCLQL